MYEPSLTTMTVLSRNRWMSSVSNILRNVTGSSLNTVITAAVLPSADFGGLLVAGRFACAATMMSTSQTKLIMMIGIRQLVMPSWLTW